MHTCCLGLDASHKTVLEIWCTPFFQRITLPPVLRGSFCGKVSPKVPWAISVIKVRFTLGLVILGFPKPEVL